MLTFASLSLGVLVATLIAAGLVLAFEIWMFVHAFRNPHISQERKLLWLVGMLLVHPFVAIAYLFTDYRRIA
jgi:hypothetical protein